MDNIFFQSWESIGRIAVTTLLAYFTLVILLRITGKRTLSKMNAFDFIVTIALGSSFATVALNKNVPLADGALVFFILIMLQFIITWLSVRIGRFKKLITSRPALLVYKGKILHSALKKERVTIEELYVAVRKKGFSNVGDIDAVIIETTGDMTVISKLESKDAQTISDVEKKYLKAEYR